MTSGTPLEALLIENDGLRAEEAVCFDSMLEVRRRVCGNK
jgi:hypothetical protein